MRSDKRKAGTAVGVGTAAAALVLGMAGTAGAAPQEGTIIGANAETAVEGNYIVKLKDGVMTTAADLGGDVKHTFSSVLNGYSAEMSEALAKRIAADPAVDYVEQVQTMHTAADQANPPSWGLDRIDQPDLPLDDNYSSPNDGDGVTAYIIDTGILTSHEDFGGRASHGYDAVDGDNDATDCNGHGTHVAGTVGGTDYGVAKNVDLVGVRVLNCQGSGTNAGVIAGIDWVTENSSGPSVANMSLGGGASAAIDEAVQNSIASGVTYGLAAGNDYGADACNSSPARTPEGITVGSTTDTDARSSFSNIGSCVDIFAPGSDITSAWIDSDTSENTISGTSMATPHVVGAAAVYLSANQGASPQQVGDALVSGGSEGVVSNPGSGSPNVLLNVVADGSTPPDEPDPEPGNCEAVTNNETTAIPDAGSTTSTVSISGCEAASADATVAVDITHSYRGDIALDLVAPDGSEYNLKSSAYDSGNDINETYTVDLSGVSEPNGEWTLRVTDAFSWDTGSLNSWTLTL
ncbi:Serine protease, subtilisin family [Prauserella aidingensis]|nr:Serine protease, subtilisin family [Prauserella aidingensis]